MLIISGRKYWPHWPSRLLVIAIILIDAGLVNPHGSMYVNVVCEDIEAQIGMSLFFSSTGDVSTR
jgi:hypothetical protein